MRFKLLGGTHVEKGVVYHKGDFISSDIDLAGALGKARFERVGKFTDDESDELAKQPVIPSRKKKKTLKEGKAKEEDTRGLDVTEDFAVAKAAGLTVFEKERWFTVFDENDVVVSSKKLRKNSVPSFLEEYLAEDVEEEEDIEEEVEEDEEELVTFDKGDRVIVNIDGADYPGSISKIKGEEATIKFDDGDTDTFAFDKLVFESKDNEE